MSEKSIAVTLIGQFKKKIKAGEIQPSPEEAFAIGMNTMRHYILNFIAGATKGKRVGEFDRGQDDALLWVAQELRYVYGED